MEYGTHAIQEVAYYVYYHVRVNIIYSIVYVGNIQQGRTLAFGADILSYYDFFDKMSKRGRYVTTSL